MKKNQPNEKKNDQQKKSQNPGLHKGGPSASSKKVEKHTRDQSGDTDESATKKGLRQRLRPTISCD